MRRAALLVVMFLLCSQSILAYSRTPVLILKNNTMNDLRVIVITTKDFEMTLWSEWRGINEYGRKLPSFLYDKDDHNRDIKFVTKFEKKTDGTYKYNDVFSFNIDKKRSIVWDGLSAAENGRRIRAVLIKMIIYDKRGTQLRELLPDDFIKYSVCEESWSLWYLILPRINPPCTLKFGDLHITEEGK